MEEELDNTLYLCFIRLIGEENDGYFRYEFIFTDKPDEVWGEDFDHFFWGAFLDWCDIYIKK